MLLRDFLTTTQTQPPDISHFWFIIMMLLLVLLAWLTIVYQKNTIYNHIFKSLQIVQLISLYAWYIVFQIPISNSLPLYHCRLAMFALFLLPDKHPLKQYFALLGISGSIFALGYPVLDPYSFPHITGITFLVGHYALFVNSLCYLLRNYDRRLLSPKSIAIYTVIMNLTLVVANLLTGGNYGLLRNTPLIGQQILLVKYLSVTTVLTMALFLFNHFFSKRQHLALAKKQSQLSYK